MSSSIDDLEDTNLKLDSQILKLQKCKQDMISIFKDLDNLEMDISSYSNNSKLYNSYLSSSKLKSRDEFEDSICLNEKSCCSMCSRSPSASSSYSDSSKSSDNVNMRINSYYDSDEDLKNEKLYAKAKNRRPPSAKMKFSYHLPLNSMTQSPLMSSNVKLDVNKLLYSVDNVKRSQSMNISTHSRSSLSNYKTTNSQRPSSRPQSIIKNAHAPPPPPKFIQKPKWSTSKKILSQKLPDYSHISSSLSNLNKFKSSSVSRLSLTSSTSANTKLSTPWRSSIKTKPDPAIFLSSQDLSSVKASQQIKQKKHFGDPKDVGGGWKHINRVKPDDNLLRSVSPPPRPKSEVEKVKKKVIIDEKDVGSGWKHVIKVPPKDDLKVYTNPNAGKNDEDNVENEKKKLPIKKDIKAWKPSGKIKEPVYPKTEISEKPQTPEVDSKPPIAKKDVKTWKPAGKIVKTAVTATKPDTKPATKPPIVPKKPTKTSNTPALKEKSGDRMLTSTPNISKNFNENDLLEESIIQKSPEEPLKKSFNLSNSSKNKSINDMKQIEASKKAFDEELNEKITDKDPIDADEETEKSKTNQMENEEDDLEKTINDEDVKEVKAIEPKKETNDNSIFKRVESKDEDSTPKKAAKTNNEVIDKSKNEKSMSARDSSLNTENFKSESTKKDEKNESEVEEDEDEEVSQQLWNVKNDDDDDE